MFSLYPNDLRKWRGGEGPAGLGFFWVEKIGEHFFWGLDLRRGLFEYSKQSEDSDGMMNKLTQTFNFYCSYFYSYII